MSTSRAKRKRILVAAISRLVCTQRFIAQRWVKIEQGIKQKREELSALCAQDNDSYYPRHIDTGMAPVLDWTLLSTNDH